MSRGRVLVVVGSADERHKMAAELGAAGFRVALAADGFRALARLAGWPAEAVVCDLDLPGLDGLGLAHRCRVDDPERVVLVLSADPSVERAVEAMRQGVSDYLVKPAATGELVAALDRGIARRRRRADARQPAPSADDGGELLGRDPALAAVLRTVRQIAPSPASVLITGESGTGKGLVARAIHRASARAAGPFVTLHCSALAESLLESELFGHERGAFTGAQARRDGRLAQADGGTLFLDEIGELSPLVQVKLLRFLQEREFERVGGNETVRVDVRVLAATHRDLTGEVASGRFREDLYYRLKVIDLEMPPLRARPGDVPLLAAAFLRRFAGEAGRSLDGFSDDALEALVRHRWPGNVRELENAVERAVVIAGGERIELGDLPAVVAKAAARPAAIDGSGLGSPPVPGASLAAMERFVILRTLEATGGCRLRAASILGISDRTIRTKLREYRAGC
jgi:DNA-binding NtrC family response regulator